MTKKSLLILVFVFLYDAAYATRITSKADLVGLPAYCYGTQGIRRISGDRTPIKVYLQRYGDAYYHLHHYCYALKTEKEVAQNKRPTYNLDYAIGDIDYVLKRNRDPDFFLLPEIYAAKARMLFKLSRPDDAAKWLMKAIAANPRYVPAYARLSDYYARRGKTDEAIAILKAGIAKSESVEMLESRLEALQANP